MVNFENVDMKNDPVNVPIIVKSGSIASDFVDLQADLVNGKDFIVAFHDGPFHADDVVCAAFLKMVASRYGGYVRVIRTRNFNIERDYSFDVGGSYDPSKNIFDHHGKDCPIREDGQRVCAATMLWHGLGNFFIANEMMKKNSDGDIGCANMKTVDSIFESIDKNFFIPLDRKDNGNKEYRIGEMMDLTSIISSFNSFSDAFGPENDVNFDYAVEVTQRILEAYFQNVILTEIGKERIAKILKDAIESGKSFAFIPKGLGPWKSVINFQNWEKFSQMKGVLTQAGENIYGVTCWPDKPGFTFGLRCKLTSELKEKHEMIFVHASGFYGTFRAESLESAMKKAEAIFDDVEMTAEDKEGA